MKKNIILSVPTAKIQIGNQAAITLDTASSQGKKSYKIEIVSNNDTITKEIDEVVKEVEDEASNIISSTNDEESCTTTSIASSSEQISDTLESAADIVVPIFGMLFLLVPIVSYFLYSAYKTSQNRKWKELLLSKGIPLEEIEKQLSPKEKPISEKNDMITYEKRKYFKYALVFTTLGIATIMGFLLSSFWVFVGMVFIGLGIGSWHYHNQIN